MLPVALGAGDAQALFLRSYFSIKHFKQAKYLDDMDLNQSKLNIAKFIAHFMFGFLLGLLISLIGGFFPHTPGIMLKETIILSLVLGLITAFWGQKALENFFKIFRFL